MSMSLLKKSMAIVEEDIADNKKQKEKEAVSKKKGVHKHGRMRNDDFVKKHAKKMTIEDIRKELESTDKRAKNNVKKLLALSKHPVKIPNAERMIERAHRGRYLVQKKEEKPVEQESLFTEEDFAAFEKELALTI